MIAVVVVVAALVASASSASSKSDDPAALFQAGADAYAAGRYDDAIDDFQRAYAIKPAPLLMLNIGQCWRKKGEHQKAVDALEQYLKDAPAAATDRAEVEDLVRHERALIPAPPPSPPVPPAPPLPPPPATTTPPTTTPSTTMPPTTTPPTTATTATTTPTSGAAAPPEDDTGLWVVVGVVGVAAVATTVALAVVLSQPPAPSPTGSLGTVTIR